MTCVCVGLKQKLKIKDFLIQPDEPVCDSRVSTPNNMFYIIISTKNIDKYIIVNACNNIHILEEATHYTRMRTYTNTYTHLRTVQGGGAITYNTNIT